MAVIKSNDMENIKEVQVRRFNEQIVEILGEECNIKPIIDETGIMHSAKVNTQQPLGTSELNALMGTADAWQCDIELARSGAGIRIQFENNVNAVVAN